jgi:hypothetical protein
MTAPLARVGQLSLNSVELGYSVAFVTQYLLAEPSTKQVIEASIVVREQSKKLLDCNGF